MKKVSMPLIVAVFLITGGLLSAIPVLNNSRVGITEISLTHRSAEFFISTAQGAENGAALFGVRMLSPVTAVSGNSALSPRSVLSMTLGAIENVGISWPTHVSSRRR